MPALAKPRHEAFAQALFQGLSKHENFSQAAAYRAAGYRTTNGNSARACASRLLSFANGIADRVAELQHEANARLQPEIDFSRNRIGKRLDMASRMAERLENPAAVATNELGIAKVFGHITDKTEIKNTDFSQAKSMKDIGIGLLAQVGFDAPSDADIAQAIEANDVLVATLEAIRDRAQGLANN